jgi:circadian clock protein KaiC
VAGTSGTGKTAVLLEFLYRGALAGEKGILFSFDETEERLRATGRGLGLDLDAMTTRGMLEIVFVPQPNILVDGDVLMMTDRIEAMGARRIGVDTVSVFIHKITEPPKVRAKIFQLATIVQNAGAVGLFATDTAYGVEQLSRSGVEESVVDGVILLSATEVGAKRQRYLEVYKLRNTAHVTGRHEMVIATGGITVARRRS